MGRLIPAGSGLAKLNSEVENVEEEFEIDLEKALSDALNEAEKYVDVEHASLYNSRPLEK